MKKDKLHTEKFIKEQEVTLRFAKIFKDGLWRSYSKEEKWVVYSITPKSVILYLKGVKKEKFVLTDENIQSGLVRIVK